MSAHTPGPWRSMPAHQDCRTEIWSDAPGIQHTIPIVAHIPWQGFVETNATEANARLIAAAPEILAALVGMLDCYAAGADEKARIHGEDVLVLPVRRARSAIRKATGGAS